jgi:hypothetical protein
MPIFTVRRDANGHACAIERDGQTILHLAAGSERNEKNAESVALALCACSGIGIYADGLRCQRDELLEACRVALSRYQATIDAIAAAGYPDNDPNRNRLEADVKIIRAAIAAAEPQTATAE